MVSRSKKSWLRSRPDGMAPLTLLAPGIADFLARRVPAALVDVQLLVGLLVHRLPVHARLPRGDADAEVDAHGQLGRAVQILERMAHARGHVRCVVLVRVGHRDPELVTAEASACVSRADCTLQLMGEHADRLVTHVATVIAPSSTPLVRSSARIALHSPAMRSTRDSAGPVPISMTLSGPGRPLTENSLSWPGSSPSVLASLSRAPSRTHAAPAWRLSTWRVSDSPTSAISVTSSERPRALAMWYRPCSSVCLAWCRASV